MTIRYKVDDPFLFIKFRKTFFTRLMPHWIILTGELFLFGWLRTLGILDVIVTNDMLKTVNGIFTTIVSFYLVFVTKIVFERWWTLRMLIGQMTAAANDMAMMLAEYTDHDDALVQKWRSRVMRYMHLAHALLHQQVSDSIDFELLEKKGFLLPYEKMKIEGFKGDYCMVAYGWVSWAVVECYKHKLILSDRWLTMFSYNVRDARRGADFILLFMETPVPFPYVQQLYWCLMCFTYINLPLLCVTDADFFGSDASRMWWPVIMAIIVASAFMGLKEVAVELQDPFGDDDVDFELDEYLDSTIHSNNAMMAEDTRMTITEIEIDFLNDLVGTRLGEVDGAGTAERKQQRMLSADADDEEEESSENNED
eukprot:GFYU01019032.1.p1 GENE.GFYU01019032.1~~GFYU01019032.1.p1  ORF type:complete len:367 (+),score=76.08 GFYU01019032.1:15-1115(+)